MIIPKCMIDLGIDVAEKEHQKRAVDWAINVFSDNQVHLQVTFDDGSKWSDVWSTFKEVDPENPPSGITVLNIQVPGEMHERLEDLLNE